MKKLGMLALGVVFAGLGAVAHATQSDNDFIVTYSATELSSAQGVRDVHARIVRAAKRNCPSYATTKWLSNSRECVADVVNELVSKVDHPRLSEYHLGNSKVRFASSRAAQGSSS